MQSLTNQRPGEPPLTNHEMEEALLAILGHRSAHSLATGPVMAEPFISPLLFTITPALSWKYRPLSFFSQSQGRLCKGKHAKLFVKEVLNMKLVWKLVLGFSYDSNYLNMTYLGVLIDKNPNVYCIHFELL